MNPQLPLVEHEACGCGCGLRECPQGRVLHEGRCACLCEPAREEQVRREWLGGGQIQRSQLRLGSMKCILDQAYLKVIDGFQIAQVNTNAL